MRSPDRDRAARVVLSRVGEPGDPRLTGLVTELGAQAVLAGLREQGARRELNEDLAARRLPPLTDGHLLAPTSWAATCFPACCTAARSR